MNREENDQALSLNVKVVVSRLFAENCYIVHRSGQSECVVVDPGLDYKSILDQLFQARLTPKAILLTHGHADHIAGVEPLKRCWPECPILIGAGDAEKLLDPDLNLSGPFGIGLTSPPADRLLQEGERVSFAEMDWDIYETPGHSAGHIIYLWRDASPWIVLGGDVLFREGVGRSDFPDGDAEVLAHSIRTKLYTLPDSTVVLPGHGPSTTIGYEKENNPFVQGIG